MEEDQFLELAQSVMSLPTAPFCEHFVSAFVRQFADQLPSLSISEDAAGNLLLMHEGNRGQGRRPRAHLIATAHMDHPALLMEERLSERDFLFRKKGGIPMQYTKGAKVAIFDSRRPASQAPIAGRITALLDGATVAGRRSRAQDAAFSVRTAIENGPSVGAGSFAMWNLVAFEQRGRRIVGRACDDLAGLACGLCYLLTLSREKAPVRAGLLLTRAEEIGFGGMAAAIEGKLDKHAVYVNIECSNAEAAGAIPGGGPIIRVGDRLSTFDPQVTAGLCFLGAELGDDFRFQRKLMDGGACEASMLMQSGFRTGAVALPLENYHNRGKKGLRPERIHVDDALGLVKLLVALATRRGGVNALFRSTSRYLKASLEGHQQEHAAKLRETLHAPLSETDDTNG